MAARKKTPAKPEAVPVNTICSVCGLPWTNHGKDPTTDDCISLLKAELASRIVPIQIPVPYSVPRRPWYWEEWHTRPKYPYEITCTSSAAKETSFGGKTYNECTPRLLNETASPSL